MFHNAKHKCVPIKCSILNTGRMPLSQKIVHETSAKAKRIKIVFHNTNASQLWITKHECITILNNKAKLCPNLETQKHIFQSRVHSRAELDYSDFKHLWLRIPSRVFPTIFVRGQHLCVGQWNCYRNKFRTHLCGSQLCGVSYSKQIVLHKLVLLVSKTFLHIWNTI